MLIAAAGVTVVRYRGADPVATVSLWSATTQPAVPAYPDPRSVEVGVRFTTSVPGRITGIRFYKGAGNSGTHTGTLWSPGGAPLATGTFTGESAYGWQTLHFAHAVPIRAGLTYVASYHAPLGHYAVTTGYFLHRSVASGPLRAPAARNGVYRYGSTAFPADTYDGNNDWVDVLFSPGGTPTQTQTFSSAPASATSSRSTPTPTPAPSRSRSGPVFPLGVWDQTPEVNAQNYANIGITQFVGLYNGPSPSSLAALAAAHLHVVTGGQSPAVLADPNASVISAWLQPDEPDNAQPRANGGYGPCIDPTQIQQSYRRFKAHDPSRPVVIGFGQGVANTHWVGRGSCTGRTDMYSEYARGADILSFDVYPVNQGYPIDIIAQGIDNLRAWGGGKPVWFDVETTNFGNTVGPTPEQTKAETWLAIIHGASGITYFCHIFKPSFVEAGCLKDPTMAEALKAQNAQIQSLARVLLTSASVSDTSVRSAVRVDAMTKRVGRTAYVFAVDPQARATSATITIPGVTGATVRVLGENRTLRLSGGSFTDQFAEYGTHIYEIYQK